MDQAEREPKAIRRGDGPRWLHRVLAERPPRLRYPLALALSVLSFLATAGMKALDPSRDFQVISTTSVVIAAGTLGWGPALLVALIGVIGVEVLLFDPVGAFVPSLSALLRILIYLALASFLASTVAILRNALAAEEVQRLQAQKAARERQMLVHIVSHDMRAPLLALDLHVAVLARLLGREVAPAIADSLAALRSSLRRSHGILRDLRDTLRIETGHFVVAPRRVDATALVRDALSPLHEQAKDRRVNLRTSVPPGTTVCADRLDQVLVNVVENALRHTPAGGTVDLTAEQNGEGTTFIVRDTGSGITPGDLPHIFEPYWTRAPEGTGTGLGLFIVERIIAAHGGDVAVTSTVGQGTTVRIRLPARSFHVPATDKGT